MRKIVRFLLALLPLFALASQTEKITLVADEWCPYNCVPDTTLPGYAVEIAAEVFRKHGIEVEYLLLPWTRAIAMTRSGTYQGIIGAIPVEAEGFLFGSEPIGLVRHTIYTSTDTDWLYKSLESLSDIRLGVIQDYSYGTELTAYIAKHQKSSAVTVINGNSAIDSLTLMLNAGRIDAFVEDHSVFRFFQSTQQRKIDVREAGVAASDEIFIAFSPQDPKAKQYRDWLDQGIQQLRQNGRLREILARYQLEDWY